jgi:protein disulfide-isomerase
MRTSFLTRWAALLLISVAPAVAAAGLTWESDLAAARARAAAEQKPLLIDFTGSTWCPPCIALNQEVLQTPQFAAWAGDFVRVKLDFPPARDRTPEKVAADAQLRQLMAWKDEYAVRGFPTLVLVGPDGQEQGRVVGYSRGRGTEKYLAQFKVPAPR